MEVIYNNKSIKNNDFLRVNETQVKPEINLSFNKSKKYLLIMYDPDAVGGTHVHWIVTNFNNSDIKNGYNLLEYKGPAPPPKTGKHRYIFELYEQPTNENIPTSIQERSISIEDLRKRLGLKDPIYKIQFISQNESGGKHRTRKRKSKRILRKAKKTKRKY